MALKLSQERKGQIALLLLKEQMAHRKISLNSETLDESMKEGLEVLEGHGVSEPEVRSLYEEIIRENVEKMFAK